jgi:gluconolactonase
MMHRLMSLSTIRQMALCLLLLSTTVGGSAWAQPEIPKGEVRKFTFEASKIYPGTTQDYWVYIPAQYSPDKPACLYVNQDGVQWNAPNVFDRLIAGKEMPVTIGLFVIPRRRTPRRR